MLFEQAMEIHDPDHQPGTEPWSSVGSGPADMADLRDALRQVRADRLTHDVEPQTLPGPLDAFALELSKREQADGFVLFGIEGDDPFEGLPDGGNPGDIVVTGDYDDPYDDWWETGGDAPGSGPGGPSGDGGGGGGGDEGDPDVWLPEPEDYDHCQDRAADALADEIAEEIAAQPDSNRREYASLIWKDASGVLHRTDLIPGDNWSVDWSGALDPSVGFNSFSQVVGVVHNHPSEVESSRGAGDWAPVDASWNFEMVWAGDWRAADSLVLGNGADWANFTMYVVFQGQVREFDWWQNQFRSRDDTAYPHGEGTESGDYDPDATCGS